MASDNSSKLASLMEEQDITADELARKMGLSVSTINSWVSGEKEPYPGVKRQLYQILGCEPPQDVPASKTPAADPRDSINKTIVKETDKAAEIPAQEDIKPVPVKEKQPKTKQAPAVIPQQSKVQQTTDKKDTKSIPKETTMSQSEVKTPTAETTENTTVNKAVETSAKTRKPAEKKSSRTSKTTASSKDMAFEAMRSTKFNTKSLNKTMSPADAKNWASAFAKNCTDAVNGMAAMLETLAEASFTVPETDPRLIPLMNAAKDASDEGITLAITILKKFKK